MGQILGVKWNLCVWVNEWKINILYVALACVQFKYSSKVRLCAATSPGGALAPRLKGNYGISPNV